MRQLLLFFALFLINHAFAQTNISGVVNDYTKVTAIDSCNNTLNVLLPNILSKGNRVLIIQMKGAEINQANAAAFGNLFNLNGAGNYEVNTVDSIYGTTIFFKYKFINNYIIKNSVQLVTIPKYGTAIVTDTLTAKKWDGETGGILILEADYLKLNAPIDVSAKGFRGGSALANEDPTNNCSWLFTVADYALPKNNWRGAEKGEGIAAFIAGKEWGRGAQLTGGGGGNDHNAGGGGGANIVKGGIGGKNNDNGTFSCQGPNPGIGGKGLDIVTSINHFYLGSGGGAGHSNNGLGSNGGNGGGIVFLLGKKIETNNHNVSVNGGNAQMATGDGAGGGGAAGTIIFDMEEIVGTATFEVKGGNGGNVNNQGSSRCFGPGGGGAGGRIIYTAPSIITGKFNGGKSGLSNNGSCNNSSNGAQQGEDGYDELFPYINIAKDIFAPTLIVAQPKNDTICVGSNTFFEVNAKGVGLQYQWQVSDNAITYINIKDNAFYNGSNTSKLSITNVKIEMKDYYYKCIVSDACGKTLQTTFARLVIDTLPLVAFQIDQNVNFITCTNKTKGGSSVTWDFGDGTISNDANPSHLYTNDGKFIVELRVQSDCGESFLQQVITIVTPPKAAFTADTIIGCAPRKIVFTNLSSENVTSYKWIFTGGTPSTSTDKNPIVNYDKAGTYAVKLVVQNTKYADSVTLASYVILSDKPKASFSYSAGANTVINFSNASSNGNFYRWDFGDGSFSIDKSPSHNYNADGEYSVTMTAQNSCGTDTVISKITVQSQPKAAFTVSTKTGCVPLTVNIQNLSSANTNIWHWKFAGADIDTSSQRNPIVKYSKAGTYDISLVAKNARGSDSIFQKAIIIVNDKPTANFEITQNQLEVMLKNTSTNYNTLKWDFGDGKQILNEEKPKHTYTNSGKYIVSLSATNNCGTTTSSKTIEVSDKLDCDKITIEVGPNPTSDYANITFNASRTSDIAYLLCSVDGRIIHRGTIPSKDSFLEIDFQNLASGVYILYFKCDEKVFTRKILYTIY